jgi:hypothetical protein
MASLQGVAIQKKQIKQQIFIKQIQLNWMATPVMLARHDGGWDNIYVIINCFLNNTS